MKAIKITNKIANKIFLYVTLYWAHFQVLLTGEARPGAHSGQGRQLPEAKHPVTHVKRKNDVFWLNSYGRKSH